MITVIPRKIFTETVNGIAPDINGNITLPIDNEPTQNSNNLLTSGTIYTALSGIQESLDFDNAPTENSMNPVTSGGVYVALTEKASLNSPELTGTPTAPTAEKGTNSTQLATTAFVINALSDIVVDAEPTDGSGNPVSSNGVYNALEEKQNVLSFDTAPKQNSNNPVTSGGVYSALAGKQDMLSFDTAPTSGSQNPVTSGGVYSAIDILHTKNAGFHNSIFRGKNLGASVTSAQWNVISSGTFDDLFIGDYWTINGIVWRIAAFDYWYNCGDTACTTHHVVIVPDANLVAADDSTTHWMNATNTTEGAYVGSDFYTGNNGNTGKAQCTTKINSAFGAGHILTHREYLQNAVKDGYGSAGAWYYSTLECMNEQMVYGGKVFGDIMHGTNIPASYTIGKSQLPLFALAPSFICNRADWWLRDVVSATGFARGDGTGVCGYAGAAAAWVGLRPAFGIRA